MNRRVELGAEASNTAAHTHSLLTQLGTIANSPPQKQSPGTKAQRRSPFLSLSSSLTNTVAQAIPPPKHSGHMCNYTSIWSSYFAAGSPSVH